MEMYLESDGGNKQDWKYDIDQTGVGQYRLCHQQIKANLVILSDSHPVWLLLKSLL